MNGAFNAVTVESPAITEITLSGPGRRAQTASAVLGDVISAMIPPAVAAAAARGAAGRDRRRFSFYLHLEVADRRACFAQVAEILGMQGVSIKSVVQKGLGDDARLVMVMHPSTRVQIQGGSRPDLAARLRPLEPRVIRVIEEAFEAPA